MTVAELVALLQAMPQGALVSLAVADPKDTAYTDEVTGVDLSKEGTVSVRGWVASDNDGAFSP